MWKDKFPRENIYFETSNGILYCGDCLEVLKNFPLEAIDLTISSPPYDNLRYYSMKNKKELKNIWNFKKFKIVAKELYRITKKGGIVVWVVGDATINGSETGNSFRQALYFKDECGFNLHDTMIYAKNGFNMPDKTRYWQCFEYMFILVKEKPRVINFIKDRLNKNVGEKHNKMYKREKNGEITYRKGAVIEKYTKRTNIWYYPSGYNLSTKDKIAFKHPAIFPEALARDHIISWSNENDIILDSLCGSGTTLKMAERLNRRWVGIEISEEYCKIAKERILKESSKLPL